MVTKILTCCISVRVPDGPIVTIIHRYEFIYSLSFCTKASHFASRHLTSGDLEGHKRSFSLNFYKQYAFSHLVFELVTSGRPKSKIMVMSMRREFRAHLTQFRSCEVKNIIFLNTDVTSSFPMLKTSSKKNKNTFSQVSSIQNHHISVQKLAKNIM